MTLDIQEKLDGYPTDIQPLISELRALIFRIAEEEGLGKVEILKKTRMDET